MVSVSSVTNTAPVANITLPAQNISAADRVSTRITPNAVSAPVADERTADNTTQRSVFTSQTLPAQTPVAANSNQSASSDSSSYITQLLSQEQDQTATADNFARFAPAIQYNRLVGYSLVKYKPSDAGLPSSLSTAVEIPTEHSAEYQAYNNTQSRNLSQLNPASPPLVIAG